MYFTVVSRWWIARSHMRTDFREASEYRPFGSLRTILISTEYSGCSLFAGFAGLEGSNGRCISRYRFRAGEQTCERQPWRSRSMDMTDLSVRPTSENHRDPQNRKTFATKINKWALGKCSESSVWRKEYILQYLKRVTAQL